MNQKINVLHIVSSLEKKGPVQVIYDLLKNSDFNKFNFIILALKPCIEDSLKKEFEKLPIKIIQLNNISALNFFKFNSIVLDIIRFENISVCHSHCTRSLIINSISCKRIKSVHSIQIYPGLQSFTMNGYLKGFFINLITKKLLRQIQFPVSCSMYVHEELLKRDNISSQIIVNGSSSKYKFDESISKSDVQNKLGLDSTFKYLVSVGRLSSEKNFIKLIDLFMVANMNGYKLIIVGDGPLEKELKGIANEDILIVGFKSNFEEYIFASDYYISTSLTEGMPLSVLVAMEASTPLILSNIPAHEEIFNTALKEGLTIGSLINITNYSVNLNQVINSIDFNLCKENVKSVYRNNYSPLKMAYLYNCIYEITFKKKYNV
jgi:glycosyltransferase involved in cell wall biosynthesis